jgi:murein DD-endopeptidase MepM/ murein hydrolase activator NlpD
MIAAALLLFPAARAQTPPPAPAVPSPGDGTEVIPLLRKPFDGEFALGNFFDHDLPFEFKDTNGYQLTFWGEQTAGIDGHDGYDWPMPEGTPLYAAADGQVVNASTTPVTPASCPIVTDPAPLNYVEIRHTAPDGRHFSSEYLHLSRIDVHRGDMVTAGQQIGLSGNTGCSTAPHLHFSVRRWEGTNSGRHVRIDPYGWSGPGPDPWAADPNGAASAWLWQDGQAPLLFRERRLDPNPNPTDNAPVAITRLRWMGYADSQNPNNEFAELTLDPRFAPSGSFDLTGFTLSNNAGESFTFPDGFVIHQDAPVRVYARSGTNTDTELYWGRSAPAWDPMGDCAHLVRPNGRTMYRLGVLTSCR